MLVYLSFALFSTWKFMFTPIAGPAAGLSFLETFLSCLAGGYLSVTIFYFGSNYFMEQSRRRKLKRAQRALRKGKKAKITKTFSKTNRTIIKLKLKLGKWMICWLVPLFFSLPLGSIITAKFYKHHKNTYVLILLGVAINCFIITGGTYLFKTLVL